MDPARFFEGRFGRVMLAQATDAAPAQTMDQVQVLALVGGAAAKLNVAGETVTLNHEALVLVNAGLPLGVAGTENGGASRFVLFQGSSEWLADCVPAVFGPDAEAPFVQAREEIRPRIRRLADTLAIEMRNDQFLAADRLEFMAQELVLSIVDSYLARRRQAPVLWRGSRFADARIRDAIALLRARPNKEMSMDTVASKVGLSRSRFYDLFQVCTGLSPRDYLDKLCVETAISRLASSSSKISEVSADLGFSAQSNFTRFFLHQVGIPPSEYRRAALRNSDGT